MRQRYGEGYVRAKGVNHRVLGLSYHPPEEWDVERWQLPLNADLAYREGWDSTTKYEKDDPMARFATAPVTTRNGTTFELFERVEGEGEISVATGLNGFNAPRVCTLLNLTRKGMGGAGRASMRTLTDEELTQLQANAGTELTRRLVERNRLRGEGVHDA